MGGDSRSWIGVTREFGGEGWVSSGCSASDVCSWGSSTSGLFGDGAGPGRAGTVPVVWTSVWAVSLLGKEVVDV